MGILSKDSKRQERNVHLRKKSNIIKLEPENSRGLCYLQSLQVEIWTWLLQTRFFDQGNNA